MAHPGLERAHEDPFEKLTGGSLSLSDRDIRDYKETDPLLRSSRSHRLHLDNDSDGHNSHPHGMPNESVRVMLLQILVPFLLAGIGTVSAGMLLDVIQVSSVSHVSECRERVDIY